MANCESCAKNILNEKVPRSVYETSQAQANVDKRRLWVVIIILIVLLFGTNLAWIICESQFETVTTSVEMENESGYVSYIGNDGDIYNGKVESDKENADP